MNTSFNKKKEFFLSDKSQQPHSAAPFLIEIKICYVQKQTKMNSAIYHMNNEHD